MNVLILTGRRKNRIFRFDAEAARIQQLAVTDQSPLQRLSATLGEAVPHASCDALILISDVGLIASCYRFPESFAWRDSGAFMQTLHFSATTYRMGFCPVGISGSEVLEAVGLGNAHLMATGVAVIGRADFG